MPDINLENPWIFAMIVTVIWIVVSGLLEVVFFDGNLLKAVIQGFVGGLAFALVYSYVQQNRSE